MRKGCGNWMCGGGNILARIEVEEEGNFENKRLEMKASEKVKYTGWLKDNYLVWISKKSKIFILQLSSQDDYPHAQHNNTNV